jgi:DNA-binding Lrp family transcriptional regulator
MPTHRSDRKIDEIDHNLLGLIMVGLSNREISKKVKIPLSTIQRRTRLLFGMGIIRRRYELDYQKLGYKKGYLHIYLSDGDVYSITEHLRHLDNILSVSIHIGNSDVVAEYVCKETSELLALIANVKHLDAVDRVVWSEEVTSMPAQKPPLPIFDKPLLIKKKT